jgi:hypothetical protein
MHGEQRFDYTGASLRNLRAKSSLNWLNSGTYHVETEQRTFEGKIEKKQSTLTWSTRFHLFSESTNLSSQYSASRIWSAAISHNKEVLFDLIPALDPSGEPCMFDTVTKKPFYNAATTGGDFIVGLTLSQAAQLGRKLPSTGGSLTLSLPEGYDRDERVVNSLAEAEAKGWVLTIQTYAAATAAATFALRRVWVRRQQDEHGSYVAADGSRWQVEWCVDVIGADPESLGYERFRSVEAAVAYWELVPYEYPEEELSTIE